MCIPIVYLFYFYFKLTNLYVRFHFYHAFSYDTRNVYSLYLFLSRTLTTKNVLSSRTLNNNGFWNLYGRHVGLTLDIDQVSRRDENLVIQQMFKS